MIIDGTQYCNWSRTIFEEMRAGGVTAVHVTIAYHEGFREMVHVIAGWNRRFIEHGDLIVQARTAADIERAAASGRTAIIFGTQNPLPIESDLGLVELVHTLGGRAKIDITSPNEGWSLVVERSPDARYVNITAQGAP